MKKLVGSLAALAILTAASAVSAADATGKIAKLSSKSITLANGMSFTMAKGASVKGLKAGDEVKVTYQQSGGQRVATKIAPAGKK